MLAGGSGVFLPKLQTSRFPSGKCWLGCENVERRLYGSPEQFMPVMDCFLWLESLPAF